jgi:RNA polymerase sigma-70 factor (ECF subfamily)
MAAEVSRRPARATWSSEERDLLARVRAGDASAFQALVWPHLTSLLALARRLTGDRQWGEDLTQETLVRAYRGLAAFRGESSLLTWLMRIQIRLAKEPGRWCRRERASHVTDLDVPDHLAAPPDQPALQRELRDRLEEAMERCTPRQRTALHLRAAEGLDYAAIATAMECTPAAARMLVLAARQRVLERMGRYLAP